MTTGRRTFGPVVLLGIAGSGFAAVAGHRAMLRIPTDELRSAQSALAGTDLNRVEFPLAGALALVALACWGVLLVTRGVVRRVVAVVAALAAAGVLAVVVVGGFVQDGQAVSDLASERLGLGAVSVSAERTPWLWVGLVAALAALAAAVAAVRFVPAWPEMGSRYDAPAGGAAPATPAEADPGEQSNLDLWKSLDEGTDPTER